MAVVVAGVGEGVGVGDAAGIGAGAGAGVGADAVGVVLGVVGQLGTASDRIVEYLTSGTPPFACT